MSKLNAFGRPIPLLVECVESPQLHDLLHSQLLHLLPGEPDGSTQQLAQQLFKTVQSAANDEDAAGAAQKLLEKAGARHQLRDGLVDRSERIFEQIEDHVIGPNVLDYGCGDGEVGRRLRERCSNYKVTLCDVMDYRTRAARSLPWRELVDGDGCMPLVDRVDSVLLLTVLHHCEDPGATLRRVMSLRPKRIVMIESVYDLSREDVFDDDWKTPDALAWITLSHEDQFRYACFWDWFYNKVVNSGVVVPYNFSAPDAWRDRFDTNGFEETKRVYLGIDQSLVPEFHVLQVFDTRRPGAVVS